MSQPFFSWLENFRKNPQEKGPLIISGPCLLEDESLALKQGKNLKELCSDYGFSYIFKTSYEKANRTSLKGNRGPLLERGMYSLERIQKTLGVPVITDIHSSLELDFALKRDLACLQIPAFLSQSDSLLKKALSSDRFINVKKLQTLSNREALQWAFKIQKFSHKNNFFMVCDRGSLIREGNLTLDFRLLDEWIRKGFPSMCDITHAAQLPSAGEQGSSGLRSKIIFYGQFATLLGVHALYLESHWNPSQALSDADVQLSLAQVELLLQSIQPLKKLNEERQDSGFWKEVYRLFPSEIEFDTQVF